MTRTNDPLRGAGPSAVTLTGQIDIICDRFEGVWQEGKQPRIEEFFGEEALEEGPTRLRQLLVQLVMVDLEWRWKSLPVDTISSNQASETTVGMTKAILPSKPRLEHYCERYPALGPADLLPDETIVAEYQARHRWGDKPSPDEYQQRFPDKADVLLPILKQIAVARENEGSESVAPASGRPGSLELLKSITLDQFLRNVDASGLMTVEEVSQFQESLPPEDKPGDGDTLAKRLVEAKRLTPYQAQRICRGELEILAFDEYVILDHLGAGGMGQVFKAEHRSMKRLVALKMIAAKLVDSPEAVRRFHREVRAAAKVIHANIVVAYDAREHAGRHCLIMEYVDGQDLGEIVKKQGPLPLETSVDYVIQAAIGLAFAHEQGIVHRDIKPGNLLLDKRGTVKILDMGLARLDDTIEDESESDRLTGSGQMMGTYDYMAPEQALDTHNIDHRADIYSLGCTFYRLLTGKRLYAGATPMVVLMRHREAPIPSLREARNDVSGQLDSVFRKMVAKEPKDRQRSMTEVIAALERCRVRAVAELAETEAPDGAVLHRPQVDTPSSGHVRNRRHETIGKFRFAKRLGGGGFRSVYRALVGAAGLAVLVAIAFLLCSRPDKPVSQPTSQDRRTDIGTGKHDEPRSEGRAPSVQVSSTRIQPEDFRYVGAFRLPDCPQKEMSWEYSGEALTYCPVGDHDGPEDGFPGSLFGAGHDWKQHVSEISIPVPINSEKKSIGELRTAQTLQPFQDIRGTLFQELESPCSGLQYLPRQGDQTSDKLYFCWGPLYQEFGVRPSHGWCELDLAKPTPAGPWHIGDHVNLHTSGYLFDIPRTWAVQYTSGMCLATGRFREGDQYTQGPSILAIAPWMEGNPPEERARLKSTALLLYSAADGKQLRLRDHHSSDEWTGAAWLTAGDKSAVIFAGTKGQGKCWYGFANGVVWPEEPPYPQVPEGPHQELNWWSDRFIGQFLFYDPDDLAAVATGDKQPYEPQPYATMEIDEYLYGIRSQQQKRHVGAVSFDRQHGYLYLLEFRGDGEKSLAHVWHISNQPNDPAFRRATRPAEP